MLEPKWDVDIVSCPNCGQTALVYDGSVRWRSGTRPPRALARKDRAVSSPRAEFKIAHYVHCTNCSTRFYDEADGRRPFLHSEQDETEGPRRTETGWIPGSIGDVSARIGYDVRDLIMEGYSQEEIDDVLYGRRTLADLLKAGPQRRAR